MINPKFKVGDKVVVIEVPYTSDKDFFTEGHTGIYLGDSCVDFNNQGNSFVAEDGIWFLEERYLDKVEETVTPISATDFLRQAAALQESRAAEYDQAGGERSAGKIAQAFNAITGHSLTEQDVWMMLVVLKQVRFYNNPAKKHRDSVEDLVSYSALFAESVFK